MSKLRVWHIPQVPGKPFYVEVESVAEGVRIMDMLAAYDAFQFENRIKGDYANVSGLEQFDETEREWMSWDIEVNSDWFDDPRKYLEREKSN